MATNFDQESIRQRLIDSLRSKQSWANILKLSTATGIIDPFAEEEARFALYSEYLLREAKWRYARNFSSLNAQAIINGYNPSRKKGATGILKVGLDETFTTPVTATISLPAGTLFSNGEYDYVTLQPYVLNIGETSVEVEVLQGTPLVSNFTAQGINFELFQIADDSIDNDNYTITVNSVEWTTIRDIREAEDGTSEVYQIQNEFDFSGINIKFGNNIFGKKLELGDAVQFSYYVTAGSLGNIVGSDQVNEVKSTIFDDNGDKVDLFVTNEDKITGGSDVEDIEQIRANAPAIGQSFNSATTKESYDAIIESISFVSKAVVWGAIEYNEDQNLPYSTFIASEENRIRISAFTDSGDQLTVAQQDEIIEEIRDRKAPTDIPLFVEVDFIRLNFVVSAFASTRTIPLVTFKQNIIDSLASNYSLFNFEFKQPLYESDYKGYIDGLADMSHHTTYVECIQETEFNNAYTADIDLQLFPITTSTVKVYVQDNTDPTPSYVLIGTDDGSGGFTAETGYDLTGSTINYTTGAGSLVVVSGLTGSFSDYSIRYFYRPTDLNLIPKERNQIFRYESADVTTAYAPTI